MISFKTFIESRNITEAKIQRLTLKKEPKEKIMFALYDFVGKADYDEYEEKGKYIFDCEDKAVIDKIKEFLTKEGIDFKDEEVTDPAEEFNKLGNDEKVLKLFTDSGGQTRTKIKDISFKFGAANGSIWNDYLVADFNKKDLPYNLTITDIIKILKASGATEAKKRV